MKIGGDYGGISRSAARSYFLEYLEKLRPDIINELGEYIKEARQISDNLIHDVKMKLDELKTEEDELDRLIENFKKNNPYPDKDPDAPTLKVSKMTDDEWLKYQGRYYKDHGEELNTDHVTRKMVDEWNKQSEGTTKEQRIWLSNHADLFDGYKVKTKKYLEVIEYYSLISRIEGFYNYLRKTEIKNKVNNWSNNHNLDSWVSDAALYSIAWWAKTEEQIGKDGITLWAIYFSIDKFESSLEFAKDEGIDSLAEQFDKQNPRMSFITPFAYNPLTSNRSWYKEHMMKLMGAKLEKYIYDIEKEAAFMELPVTPDTRNTERFDWLVRYQVNGESFNKIAKSVYTSREAVTARVKETADWCGITLRPSGKPGRPRKQ